MQPLRLISLLCILMLSIGLPARPASAADTILTFTVRSADELNDAAPGDGLCATALATCTLRAAIQEANAYPGPNKIFFRMPGYGFHSFMLTAGSLPAITGTVTLDATTQPNCTVPCIILDGHLLAGTNNGLTLQADNSLIRGFIIHSFSGAGILITGNANRIQRNHIGLYPWGTGNDIGIDIRGTNNIIGGTTAGKRNIVSGNVQAGISVGTLMTAATSNTIQGNYIGTNPAGTLPRPNTGSGIVVWIFAGYTRIGGTVSGARNIISGNAGHGIQLGSSENIVQGNFIGTTANGSGDLENGGHGIWMSSVYGNIIGGSTSSARNRIAFNDGGGIAVHSTSDLIAFTGRNSFFSNGGLAIDLGDDGVTPNDNFDADTGPNGMQNFPVILSANSATGVIKASLFSKGSADYIIEFYSSPRGTCNVPVPGQGKTFLGSKKVTTNVSGYVTFRFTSPRAFTSGSGITATARDNAQGGTSEFSLCLKAH